MSTATITLTHALLKAAAQRPSQMDAVASHATPPGFTVDTVSGTDHLYSDGDTIGAIARIETTNIQDPSVYVWPNGRVWNRDGSYPAAVVAWIKACREPDTGSATNTTVSDTKSTQ
jgi:hypothetical protein